MPEILEQELQKNAVKDEGFRKPEWYIKLHLGVLDRLNEIVTESAGTYPALDKLIEKCSEDEIKRYTDKIATINEPKNPEDYLWRFVYAVISPRLSWIKATQLVLKIKKLGLDVTLEQIRELIKLARLGLHNSKAKYVMSIITAFKNNTDLFSNKKPTESWLEFRHRLLSVCNGLSLSKGSNGIEMCFPLTAQVMCIDTWYASLFGLDPKENIKPNDYVRYENYFLRSCARLGHSPYVIRHLVWDKIRADEAGEPQTLDQLVNALTELNK
jgi:hypothetical protein